MRADASKNKYNPHPFTWFGSRISTASKARIRLCVKVAVVAIDAVSLSVESPTSAEVLVGVAAAAIPCAIAPGIVLEHDVIPKLVVLLCCTAGLLFGLNTWCGGAKVLLQTRSGRMFAILIGLQCASVALSTALSQNPSLSLAGSAWRRFGFITQASLLLFAFICAAVVAGRSKVLRRILTALTFASCLISAYAIAQYAGWDPFLAQELYRIDYFGGMLRVPSTLGHAVYLGAFLSATIPITMGLSSQAGAGRRLVLWSIAGLSLAAVFLCGSRSSLVALGAALAVYTSQGGIRARALLRLAAICLVCGLCLALFLATSGGELLRHRMRQWRQDLYGGPRLLLWRDTVRMLQTHPIVGFGPDTFANEFRQHQSTELARQYPQFRHESPHNLFLDLAAAQGLPGVLVVLGLIYLAFGNRSSPAAPEAGWLRASVAATLVSLLFTTVTITGALMLYLVVALIVATEIPVPGEAAWSGTGKLLRVAATVTAAVLLSAACAYYVRDRVFAAVAGAMRTYTVDAALKSCETAAGFWFPGPGDDLWCSRQLAFAAGSHMGAKKSALWKGAANSSARAERTSDEKADAVFQSALLAVAVNDPLNGERKLREAIRVAPTWYKPHLLLAQLLQAAGRHADAAREAERTLDLAGPLRADVERALQAENH